MTTRTRVRAAGGVIVRRMNGSEPELLLIHRFRRNDWTFPKGKVEAGETDAVCWVSLARAAQLLTYQRDRDLLDRLPA